MYNAKNAQKAGEALKGALSAYGYPSTMLPILLAQVAHETGGFNSILSTEDNNLSGIKFVEQSGATKGRKSPEGNYYAKYANTTLWAKDYLRILSKGGQNAPIKATDSTDFVNRLKDNGYFTDTLENYQKAIKSWSATVAKILPTIGTGGAVAGLVLIIISITLLTLYMK
jgi:hypothetical protein